MTDYFSDVKTYRYNVPFDGTFATKTGVHETIGTPRHDQWAGPGDYDPIELQH